MLSSTARIFPGPRSSLRVTLWFSSSCAAWKTVSWSHKSAFQFCMTNCQSYSTSSGRGKRLGGSCLSNPSSCPDSRTAERRPSRHLLLSLESRRAARPRAPEVGADAAKLVFVFTASITAEDVCQETCACAGKTRPRRFSGAPMASAAPRAGQGCRVGRGAGSTSAPPRQTPVHLPLSRRETKAC